MVRTFDVLSIDAWNGPDGWTWNASFKAGEIAVDPAWSTRKLLRAFREAGFLAAASAGRCRIDNDGADPTTIEIQDRSTGEPLFAIRVEWSDDDAT